jgi:hypothetical protein
MRLVFADLGHNSFPGVDEFVPPPHSVGWGSSENSTLGQVRPVPSDAVLSLFYPVLSLSPTVVDRANLLCFKIRVGHNKSDTWEKFTHVPFYFTEQPFGAYPGILPGAGIQPPSPVYRFWLSASLQGQ